jgi:hypothetical protein
MKEPCPVIERIDDGNALFCVEWVTSYDPQEVIESLMGTFRYGRLSPAEMRDMAGRERLNGRRF